MFKKITSFILSIAVFTQVISCAHSLNEPSPGPGDSPQYAEIRHTESSIAHLRDGFLVSYPHGYTVRQDTIRTLGFKYSDFSPDRIMISRLPLTEVDYIEHNSVPPHSGKMILGLNTFTQIFVGIITFFVLMIWKFGFPAGPWIA